MVTERNRTLRRVTRALIAAAFLTVSARADEITDWNRYTMEAVRAAGLNGLTATRLIAMVHTAAYDAVNGIERQYEPYHVASGAPPGASRRAAAIEAAYTVLVTQLPLQESFLTAKRGESLTAAAHGSSMDHSVSIQNGLAWGQGVARDIMAWRATDGFTPTPPPFTGGTAPGQWRPTPPGFVPGTGPQFAYMTPWAMPSPSAFEPGPPPALTSAAYTTDFNEVREIGRNTSATRTTEQSQVAAFWFGGTSTYWEPVARTMAERRGDSLLENARFFALMNVAMADAAIACWNAKYTPAYSMWRPITAINLADTDGNPSTEADDTWRPFINTPTHPEYLSGHSTVSGAAAMALQLYYGDSGTFTVTSDVVPGAVRSFTSFDQAAIEVGLSRLYAGVHFRTACEVGKATGEAVAQFVTNNLFKAVHGKK